jgi:DNA-binding transcriptional LysR family regulator
MELRHLRYFVAVAEEGSFVRAAKRLRVAQPALSKQIRDLETEVGVVLFERLPRGVRLTRSGEVFLVDARNTLDDAARAVAGARAADVGVPSLHFAHGELFAYTAIVEGLLAAFHTAHPDVQLRVSSQNDSETYDALRERRIDVGCVFLADWPLEGLGAHRLVDCPVTGVLLPAGHPLAAQPTVRLPELASLAWLHSAPQRWPSFIRTVERALRARGLEPRARRERSRETSANTLIAAGELWALATDAIGAPYRAGSTAIVYRPFVEPPIPCWIALVWHEEAAPMADRLVAVARRAGLDVRDAPARAG